VGYFHGYRQPVCSVLLLKHKRNHKCVDGYSFVWRCSLRVVVEQSIPQILHCVIYAWKHAPTFAPKTALKSRPSASNNVPPNVRICNPSVERHARTNKRRSSNAPPKPKSRAKARVGNHLSSMVAMPNERPSRCAERLERRVLDLQEAMMSASTSGSSSFSYVQKEPYPAIRVFRSRPRRGVARE
jgi:hypothetical protein